MIDFSKNPLFLAPLAGFSDLPFRSVVKKFGADVSVSEMISSNALMYKNKKTLKMIKKASNESPYAVQIVGGEVEPIKKAVEFLNEIEGIDIIDLNCGCPAPKVANNNQGSSLLKDLDRLKKLLETIKKHSNKKYTSAKVRIGYDQKTPVDIAKAVEDAGADFIVVHGRTKKDGYKKDRIDYDSIALMKKSVKIPVIANGEIDSLSSALSVLEITGADGLMIGRGAIGNPWIFHQLKSGEMDVSSELKKEIILEHFYKMVEHYGEFGVVIFRKHLHTYSKGYNSASLFRDNVNSISKEKEMEDLIISFF